MSRETCLALPEMAIGLIAGPSCLHYLVFCDGLDSDKNDNGIEVLVPSSELETMLFLSFYVYLCCVTATWARNPADTVYEISSFLMES